MSNEDKLMKEDTEFEIMTYQALVPLIFVLSALMFIIVQFLEWRQPAAESIPMMVWSHDFVSWRHFSFFGPAYWLLFFSHLDWRSTRNNIGDYQYHVLPCLQAVLFCTFHSTNFLPFWFSKLIFCKTVLWCVLYIILNLVIGQISLSNNFWKTRYLRLHANELYSNEFNDDSEIWHYNKIN